MALKGFQVTLESDGPLLCSNVQSSDPLGEGSKQKAFFHSKKKKNDEDHRALRTLDSDSYTHLTLPTNREV